MIEAFVSGVLCTLISVLGGQAVGAKLRDVKVNRRLEDEMDEVALVLPNLVTQQQLGAVLGQLAQEDRNRLQAIEAAAQAEMARRVESMRQQQNLSERSGVVVNTQLEELQKRLSSMIDQVARS